ncbi:MAG: AAA family ATPase [Bdellovibrionota bacterium]
MKIEGIRVKNFRSLKDIELKNIPKMCVFLGENGAGKSTLFKVFGFLKTALKDNIRVALAQEGGFKEVISRGEKGFIEFEISFRVKLASPKITYLLAIGLDEKNRPVVEKEILKYRRGQRGKPWHYLDYSRGKGFAVTNELELDKIPDEKQLNREEQALDSPDILAIKGLGQFKQFPAVAAFRKLIENWHLSDIHISDARKTQEAGYAEHLSTTGDNTPLVAQYFKEQHPEILSDILKKLENRVPGISEVAAVSMEDGQVALKFKDKSFSEPFLARYVSDGTVKMFAYLLLLNDPFPHPLLCIEEPENQLYPHLMRELVAEFRDYAQRGGQIFVSTHSPDFVNNVELEELFWITKENGFSKIHRAIENEDIVRLYKEGDLLGSIWQQGLLYGDGIKI